MYRTHVRPVFAFLAYSVSAQTAEDLTATTFERVVRSWERFDPNKGSERTWVLSIARNVLTDHYRRQRHRSGPSIDQHPAIADSLAATDDPLAAAVSASTVRGWLEVLSHREREVLALRFGADLSAREVAHQTGFSEANVHQITSRALRRLRVILEQEVRDTSTGALGE